MGQDSCCNKRTAGQEKERCRDFGQKSSLKLLLKRLTRTEG